MVLVGVAGSLLARRVPAILRCFTVGGCLLRPRRWPRLRFSATAGTRWPLAATVFALGFANGVFAVAAIASMMALAGTAGKSRDGVRMGLWGAAQAIAFGLGGFAGTVAVDLLRAINVSVPLAYGSVFLLEGSLFLAAAVIASMIAPARTAAGGAGMRLCDRHAGCRMTGPHRPATMSWWSAAGRLAPRRPPTSPPPDAACCCSTGPGGSSRAAARSHHG